MEPSEDIISAGVSLIYSLGLLLNVILTMTIIKINTKIARKMPTTTLIDNCLFLAKHSGQFERLIG